MTRRSHGEAIGRRPRPPAASRRGEQIFRDSDLDLFRYGETAICASKQTNTAIEHRRHENGVVGEQAASPLKPKTRWKERRISARLYSDVPLAPNDLTNLIDTSGVNLPVPDPSLPPGLPGPPVGLVEGLIQGTGLPVPRRHGAPDSRVSI